MVFKALADKRFKLIYSHVDITLLWKNKWYTKII